MTDAVRQCWAFHRDGTRCDMPAGHTGDHAVERTWSDDDCAMPTAPPPAPPVVLETVPIVEPAANCVACQHKHKGGQCKCGCHEFVG
jgi:hypothetical protein